MKLLPYEKTEERVNLSKADLIYGLSEHVQLKPYYRLICDQKEKPFHGKVGRDEWNVFLKTPYRNNFKPQIRMKIKSLGSETQIIFEFRLARHIKIFLSLWTFLILLFTFPWNQRDLMDQEIYDLLLPIGMIGFVLLITYLGFYMELDKYIAQLKKTIKK